MGKRTSAAGVILKGGVHVPVASLDDPRVAAVTARIEEIQAGMMRGSTDHTLAAGRLLHEAKVMMPTLFLAWLKRCSIRQKTGNNYMALAAFERHSPGLVAHHKDLGPTRLYKIARLRPEARETVLRTPGLGGMNDEDFAKVVKPHIERKRKVTPRMRANGVKQRLQGMTRKLLKTKIPAVTDEALRESMRVDVRALGKVVEEMKAKLGE